VSVLAFGAPPVPQMPPGPPPPIGVDPCRDGFQSSSRKASRGLAARAAGPRSWGIAAGASQLGRRSQGKSPQAAHLGGSEVGGPCVRGMRAEFV
jgi:hypothetical protein